MRTLLLFIVAIAVGCDRSDVQIIGQPAAYLTGSDVYHGYVGMTLDVKNVSGDAVSEIQGKFEFVDPQRATPFIACDFRLEVPGGIEPGETKTVHPSCGSPVKITADTFNVSRYPEGVWRIRVADGSPVVCTFRK